MSEPNQNINLDMHPPAQKVGGMRVKQANHTPLPTAEDRDERMEEADMSEEDQQQMISMEREREKAFREKQRAESYGQTPTLNIHGKEPNNRMERGAGYNPAFQPRSMNH
ncbi:hypothetical protein O0I10_010768 [Lichtheimia ornata]|uniref:Uncharacterized protein n=1 Tax=Lichtheimia ornata TaxID=688661 RepID=A0AAD7XUR4_9FUNG|nr:uncharacterized protein O0I10_010768 [Lichtheimia ornata]KAJ8653618.1 hypothetical protein O0I10_010768 [Lichtheimia ornata]